MQPNQAQANVNVEKLQMKVEVLTRSVSTLENKIREEVRDQVETLTQDISVTESKVNSIVEKIYRVIEETR